MINHDHHLSRNNGVSDKRPLVSIFMPVFNQEQYVAAALDSVLSQTYENIEIVISDDCSQDSTPTIVGDYANKFPEKIHFYKLADENLGGRHFQLLLNKCKGQYVCMFAGDDIMYPMKIERQIDDVLRFGLAFHGHSVDCIDAAGNIFSDIKVNENKFFRGNSVLIINGIPVAGCSWMVRMTYATFTPSLGFLHDFDMVIRALMNERIGYVCADKLGAYRITKTSWSRNLNCRSYLFTYSKLYYFWLSSRMYSECLFLIFGILARLLGRLLSFIRFKY